MATLNEFDIEVLYKGENLPFHIKMINMGTEIKTEVWKDGSHYFTLVCCTDLVGDTLKLAPTFESAGIDIELARAVGYVVESEME